MSASEYSQPSIDIAELRAFYENSVYARNVVCRIAQVMRRIYPIGLAGLKIMGVGYASPIFEKLAVVKQGHVLLSERTGAAPWPADSGNRCAIVSLDAMPIADDSVDCIICMHVFETINCHVDDKECRDILGEISRTLVCGGKAVLIVPMTTFLRRPSSDTPFGKGHKVNARLLRKAIKNAGLTIVRAHPISGLPSSCRLPFFAKITGRMGGLLLIEVHKEVTAPVLAGCAVYYKEPAFGRRLVPSSARS